MKKGVPVAMVLMWMTTLLLADLTRAASSGDINGTFTGCAGSELDCLIADDWDAEFPVESHFGRMLYDLKTSVTGGTGTANKPDVNCPKAQGYRSCLPPRNGGNPKQPCGDYTRNC